ncbi:transporter substrate-binding domain-containing protein [Pseudomonas sp. CAU 1711]|uniref:substrate-binding periplasmic protein n=1 Tax=Pseudomonas sp. CAU 1711 TaxID=3140356 RepID=UPI003260839B
MSPSVRYLPTLLLLVDIGVNAASLEVVADEWCPINCRPEDAAPGYAIEILNAVFAQDEIDYRVLPWKRAVHNVKKGTSAAAIGAGSDITEREGLQVGQEPIGLIYDCLYVASGNPARYRGNADDLNSIKRLGIALGYVYEDGFKEWIERPDNAPKLFITSGDQPSMRNLRKLVDGSLDGMIEAGVVMDYQLLRTGLAQQVISAGCDTPQPIYMAFGPKGTKGDVLIEAFDKGMADLRHSGRLGEILRKYGVRDWK